MAVPFTSHRLVSFQLKISEDIARFRSSDCVDYREQKPGLCITAFVVLYALEQRELAFRVEMLRKCNKPTGVFRTTKVRLRSLKDRFAPEGSSNKCVRQGRTEGIFTVLSLTCRCARRTNNRSFRRKNRNQSIRKHYLPKRISQLYRMFFPLRVALPCSPHKAIYYRKVRLSERNATIE